MTWNEFQSANKGMYDNTGMSEAWGKYKKTNGIDINATNEIHGNSLSNLNTNYGYALVDKDTGEILKFGETLYPDTRYSKSYLESKNAEMRVLESGNKIDMHYWQYDMNKYYFDKYDTYPPLNPNGW
ncbi:hypothetical protein Clocel_3600 [Clostridium cellulovorans 743B]|uniref:Uncharacterized protein n=1 Tax=Clostridium cellulovorans (strain ATCC 35296 / DSM 3052 / OCM 3 / 743B) TaxID=573061 RepID=D9SWJ2_CLOC7|nr:hypothetical protein Clocel_3600 [Clostridium cellulovorans 743B]